MIPYGKQTIDKDDLDSVLDVLQSDYLTTGPQIGIFEKALCDSTHSNYAIALSNGTAALHLSALCLFKPNDKVLVTPNTFVASANAIVYAGAKPIFCDIADDGNIDLDLARKLCEADADIRGVVAVHFSGKSVDLQKLAKLKQDFNLKVIEDGAHGLGMAGLGSIGDLTTLSFHPVKHITTGEGGAVVTNNEEIANKIKLLRTHGITRQDFINKDFAFDENGLENPWYYEMHELGFNYRITDFQCALGTSQIKKLSKFVEARKIIAKTYEESFKNLMHIKPLYNYDENSSYHLFVSIVDFTKIKKTKAELFLYMKENGVFLQSHYIPVNLQPYYKTLGYNYLNTPNALNYYLSSVSLPMYPSLTQNEQQKVIDILKAFIG